MQGPAVLPGCVPLDRGVFLFALGYLERLTQKALDAEFNDIFVFQYIIPQNRLAGELRRSPDAGRL